MSSDQESATNGISLPTLSMTEPWGTLVATKQKRFETRSWQTHYRGLVAIHSASGFPAWAKTTCLEEPFRSALKDVGYNINAMPVEDWKTFNLPLGCVIALAQLIAIERIDEGNVPPEPERFFGNYTPGRYKWEFGEVLRFSRPIPAKGTHRLWRWHPPRECQDEIASLLQQMHTASEQKEEKDDHPF